MQHKPWKLSLRAEAKNLGIRLKASKILPVCKLFSFSFQIRLHPYLLQLKSKPQPSFSWKPKSLKPKLVAIFKNFHIKRVKSKGRVRNWCVHKNYIHCYKRRRKGCIFLWVLLFGIVGFFIIMLVEGFFWKYIWKSLIYTAPSGFVFEFAKVIFNGISGAVGV